jgi:O26-antigen biosynthesis N-acetyl-L-fucosamine transferase
MHFILLTDYYDPIVKSGSIIVGDLAEELLKQGHKIVVLTFDNEQKVKYDIEDKGSLQIVRIKSLSRKYGKVGRLWAEINYSRKIIHSLKNLNTIQCDGVICYAPSIFYGRAIKWIRRKYNSKAYLVIRDIFPKWALEAGLLTNGLLFKYFKSIESDLYSSFNVIGIEAKSDLQYFQNYGFDGSIQIEVLNNWGSPFDPKEISLNKLPNPKKINIVYGGNMGDAQDLLSLVNMIDFSVIGEKAHLFLIGNGNQFNKIKSTLLRKNILNVTTLAAVDKKTYISILSKADIGLVSLSNKMTSHNYPLKMIGYMQLSKPILASVNKNNEIISMIQENNIGLVSLAQDKDSFNKNLKTILSNQALRKEQGNNALQLFEENFTVKAAAGQIIEHFK